MVLALLCRLRQGRTWYLQPRGMQIIQRWMQQLAYLSGIRISQYGQQQIDAGLLVANHVSFLDIIVLSSITPVRFLSKDVVRYWPVIGWLTTVSGTVYIQRSRRARLGDVLETVASALQHQRPIVVFPEGTTSSGEQVKKFHSGLYQAAIEAQVPVQAMAIRYIRDGKLDRHAAYYGRDNFILKLLRILSLAETYVQVHFCPQIDSADMTRRELSQLTQQQVASRLNTIARQS